MRVRIQGGHSKGTLFLRTIAKALTRAIVHENPSIIVTIFIYKDPPVDTTHILALFITSKEGIFSTTRKHYWYC